MLVLLIVYVSRGLVPSKLVPRAFPLLPFSN